MSKRDIVGLAMKKAFNYGQTYYSQADSERSSDWKKADVTAEKFQELLKDTLKLFDEDQP